MIIVLAVLLFLFQLNHEGEEPGKNPAFISPVKIPLALSANFGELRSDHFHSGVDIKTQGTIGKEIVAAADGYVYRINVSPGGFGKAVYLRHQSGYSTVYGHLDRFTPEIEEYVKARQYEEKSYMVTLWPPKDRFNFRQGDVIAYSGNSGSSTGPHLHYEIRKSAEEIPVNPLLFEFGVMDNIRPVIEKLVIYPVGKGSRAMNGSKPLVLNVRGSNGRYSLQSAGPIPVSGTAGFGIKAHDLLNNSNNKCGLYSLELRVDSTLIYSHRMESFSFSETRYINGHIDYEMLRRDKAYFERAFVLPNVRLSVHDHIINRGLFSFSDGKTHKVEITASDVHGNVSRLAFQVTSVPEASEENNNQDTEKVNAILMPYNRNNRFVSGNVAVSIPPGTLYDTLYFEFSRSEGGSDSYSDIYHIHNNFIPVHKPYLLAIKPTTVPKGKESKMLIIQVNGGSGKIPYKTVWKNGSLSASPNSFGRFFVGIDTIAPVVTALGFSDGANLSGRSSMRIRIKDDLSGIKSYEPLLDDKWALFEYDQKDEVLIYKFDPSRIKKGTTHSLSLKVTDNVDNTRVFSCDFTW